MVAYDEIVTEFKPYLDRYGFQVHRRLPHIAMEDARQSLCLILLIQYRKLADNLCDTDVKRYCAQALCLGMKRMIFSEVRTVCRAKKHRPMVLASIQRHEWRREDNDVIIARVDMERELFKFTDKEITVIKYLAKGYTKTEIARELDKSPQTIHYIISWIRKKLNPECFM